MYLHLLDRFRCPNCQSDLQVEAEAEANTTCTNGQTDLEEGIIRCQSNPTHRYLVVDGVAILVPDFNKYLTTKPGLREEIRQMASTGMGVRFVDKNSDPKGNTRSDGWEDLQANYIWSHFDSITADDPLAECMPEESQSVFPDGADPIKKTVESMLTPPSTEESLGIDIGSSVGGLTHVLSTTVATALGCDRSFRAIRLARQIRDTDGKFTYEVPLEGKRTESRTIEPEVPNPARVEFVVSEAGALPIESNSIDSALSMNMIDVVPTPRTHLMETDRVLDESGRLIVGDPYDWSKVSPAETTDWIGGTEQTPSPQKLREILTEELSHSITEERPTVPWTLRFHGRRYSILITDCIASRK